MPQSPEAFDRQFGISQCDAHIAGKRYLPTILIESPSFQETGHHPYAHHYGTITNLKDALVI